MSDARLRVDPRDPTPPYEQVRRQLHTLIRAGVLRGGDRLPPLRQLAGDLGLAVGTVARAYSELEEEGLLTSRRGAGTRVVAGLALPQNRAALDELAKEYLARATATGATAEEALIAVRAHIR